MHHAGAGVTPITAPGRPLTIRTQPSIHAKSHELQFAHACASGAHHASASCAAPSAIVTATHGTIARFAATAYGVICKNVAAPSGQTPSWVANERTSASRTRSGNATRASIQRSSGWAQAKIAPTHENESANDVVATLAG